MATINTNPIPQNFTPTAPTLKDLLDLFKQQLMIEFNSHHIGTLQSFNSENQTAKATLNYQKTSYVLNSLTQQYVPVQTAYPILADCPVVILGGGDTSLTFPFKEGDECLILFNDRDIDNWFAGSSTSGVATPRLHSFADALILVGMRSLPNVLEFYDTIRLVLRAGTVENSIAAVGVNPNNSKVLITNTYPANSTTLDTLLQDLITKIKDLITAINAITVTTSIVVPATPFTGSATSGTPNNSASISAIATQLTTIATQIGGMLE